MIVHHHGLPRIISGFEGFGILDPPLDPRSLPAFVSFEFLNPSPEIGGFFRHFFDDGVLHLDVTRNVVLVSML
jgi:hypothetical protein